MLLNAINRYLNNFKGFTREIWILTIITFINRAGTMVIPFLSKYLKEELHFSYNQVGWIMVCFGTGSMIGSWLGGKLSDKIGFYRIMIFSLLNTGILLFFLNYITSFTGLCIGMFVLMIIADMFRPAMFVSIGAYAKPENRTRALTLVRLAVNLGFSAGPALGGIIIMSGGYRGLFRCYSHFLGTSERKEKNSPCRNRKNDIGTSICFQRQTILGISHYLLDNRDLILPIVQHHSFVSRRTLSLD
jgi:predicted MFS family arabinose efflux permease